MWYIYIFIFMVYMCLVVVCMIYIYNYIQLNDMVEKKNNNQHGDEVAI